MARQKKDQNFLDFIPRHACQWEENENGVALLVPRFRNPLLQKISIKMGRSEFVRVQLDHKGTRVWKLIDGQKSILGIGQVLRKVETEEAEEQTFQRLAEFVSILSKNRFVDFVSIPG